jgi:hypothetical protein
MTLAVLGSKESGKSHFIAVLINSLRQEIGADLDASLVALNDETIERYQRHFHDPIFSDRVVLDATKSLSRHAAGKAPMIFCLKLRSKGVLGEKFAVATLVFFDTAGEDLDNIDLMEVEAKYIGRSDGIIFLVDPLQIPGIRDRVSGVPLPDMHTDPATVATKIARVIRTVRRLDMSEPIETPLAFTVSKLDVFRTALPRSSRLFEAPAHDTCFSVRDFKNVDSEVRSHLCEWFADSGAMVREIDHNFKTAGFFAVSALGESPDSDGTLGVGVAPIRIGDPLLWLLAERGLIEKKDKN